MLGMVEMGVRLDCFVRDFYRDALRPWTDVVESPIRSRNLLTS